MQPKKKLTLGCGKLLAAFSLNSPGGAQQQLISPNQSREHCGRFL